MDLMSKAINYTTSLHQTPEEKQRRMCLNCRRFALRGFGRTGVGSFVDDGPQRGDCVHLCLKLWLNRFFGCVQLGRRRIAKPTPISLIFLSVEELISDVFESIQRPPNIFKFFLQRLQLIETKVLEVFQGNP